MDLSSLKTLQQNSKRSYNDQKSIIKKVLAGKVITCKACQQPVTFAPAADTRSAKVGCAKGCTDIELDIS
ncbi:hypothetical protein DXX93_15580 [Thalassotalea euphylliae]|uniref:Uncharacterized protein n=1 Tax=Thalassotalea euphylliae TaxID=1655234 RepID=A0A3E0TU03_9GAMM|nr:hypothetical protein [Thalassotalea euphylliae]REL27837.1 hypothetical protein DXX93_15580 [Thalassotalea euphylliae]